MKNSLFSISIMAHPKRRRFVIELLNKLKDLRVAWDQNDNIWNTCSEAWKLHNPAAEWHLVLQDDSIPCKNFLQEVEFLLKQNPGDHVFSLYLGNRKRFRSEVERFKPKGGIYISDNIHHEIALIFPVKRIFEMLEFCEKLNPENDKVINEYVRKNKLKVLIPLPSLIQHKNSVSLHNENTSLFQNRTSIWFKGE